MDSAIQKVYETILTHAMLQDGDSVVAALSGGADSVFMLLALQELQTKIDFKLSAAHLNHGIRGKEAERDCEYCRTLCEKKQVDFYTKTVNIPQISKECKLSEENAGRIERYKYFNELCAEYGFTKIAVAHNKNDCVETLLLNLIRGCSLNGLKGIIPINGNIIRPITDISRNEIEKHLSEYSVLFCTDSTNLTQDYTRNKIRHSILPQMERINPSVIQTVYTNIPSFREDADFIENYANRLNCISIKSNNTVSIDKTIFDKQHISIKKRILMKAFEKIKGDTKNIEAKHLAILLSALQSGKKYEMPEHITVSIQFDQIIFSAIPAVSGSDFEIAFSPAYAKLKLPVGDLSVTLTDSFDIYDKTSVYIDYDKIVSKKMIVRNKRDGDSFIPYGMSKRKKLKQLFLELKIPLDERKGIPILWDKDTIAAVIPYRVSDLYKVTDQTKTILRIQMIKGDVLQ